MEETKPLPKQKGRRGTGTVSLGGSVVSRYAGTVRSFEGGRSSVAPRGAKDSAMLQSSQDSSKAGETKAISKMPENMDELVKINKNTEKTYKVTNKAILQILKVLLQVEKLVAKSEKKKKKEPTTLERLMERLKKYSPENLLKTGKEKLKDKSVSLVNRGLDKMGVKARLDKLDERDKKLNIQRKKSGLDKTNIKSKSYIDRVPEKGPAETFASDKKSVAKVAGDKSVMSRVMPNAVRSLGSSMGSLIPIVLKVLLAVLVIAAAAGIGYLLYKLLIEPNLDRAQKKANEELKRPGISAKDVVTDKGEKVFEKTDTKTGEKSYITQEQMNTELSKMTDEEKQSALSGSGPVSYVAAKNVTDLATNKPMGNTLPSGASIEEINKTGKEQELIRKQKESTLTPEQKEYESLKNRILRFDGLFRESMVGAMNIISTPDYFGRGGLTMQATAMLEPMLEQHKALIQAIKQSSISDEQKAELTKISPLLEGSLENEPSISTSVGGLEYWLPNNTEIELADWKESASGIVEEGVSREQHKKRLDEFLRVNPNTPGSLQQNLTPSPYQNQTTPSQTKVGSVAPTSSGITVAAPQTTGNELQQLALKEKTQTPAQSSVQTTAMQQPPVVINNNNNSTTNASMSGGGGGAAQYATATPPESSSMEPALLGRDESRSASLGGNSS